MNQIKQNDVARLERKMESLGLKPTTPIVTNNQRHIYSVMFDGKKHLASYIASRNPMYKTKPALICSFGLLDDKRQHYFSSEIE